MKKLLLVCFLAVGTILPNNKVMSSMVAQARLVTITIEGWWLTANAGPTSGTLQEIQIYKLPQGELVRTQTCGGYTCTCSLEGLPAGKYLAYVIAQNETGTKKFAII